MPSPDDFDFWLGTWSVRWGTGDDETGRDVISRAFGGRVVEEQFDGRPGVDLRGMSMSVFDAASRRVAADVGRRLRELLRARGRLSPTAR